MKRLAFIQTGSLFIASFFLPSFVKKLELKLMTVNGPINAGDAGVCLEHEHILVDFIGAEKYDPSRWNRDEVIEKVLPYLLELYGMYTGISWQGCEVVKGVINTGRIKYFNKYRLLWCQ